MTRFVLCLDWRLGGSSRYAILDRERGVYVLRLARLVEAEREHRRLVRT